MNFAIIDCAMMTKSHNCFNRLLEHFDFPMTYHIPSMSDCTSLKRLKKEPDAYIIFGSASHVHQKLDWQIELSNFIKEKLEKGVPVLGICFGHQLLAYLFDAKIDYVKDENTLFEGTRTVDIIHPFCGFKKGDQIDLIVTHYQEVKNLPENFIHLGTSKDCTYDIIAHKELPLLSLQGHPEASKYFCEKTLKQAFDEQTIEAGMKGGIKFLSGFVNSLKEGQKTFHTQS